MKKILIADHIETYRNSLKRSLESHGFSICEVSTEEELFALSFDDIMLVLIADNLAGRNAFDILTKAKSISKTSNMPFIICSSQDAPDYIARCVKHGFKDIILRPYNRNILFRKIKTFLVESGLLDKNMFLGTSETEKIQEKEKIEFLKEVVAMTPAEIKPEYDPNVPTGYAYPMVNDFFGITLGEGYNILRELYDENAISRTLFDKVGLCPTCNYHTLNFREVCPKCKSLDINIESVYHHFSCGYIGPATDFRPDGSARMTCPKCEKPLRHIGLDYEKPSDTFICAACHFICTEPRVEFKCFYCNLVAPAEDVVITNIYTYHSNPKTEKIVEYGSFAAFDIKKVLESDNKGQFSRDFFEYMLKMKYQEHLEFGDPLILLIIHTGTDMDVLEDAQTYISSNIGPTSLIYKIDDNAIVLISSRRSLREMRDHARNILVFSKQASENSQKEGSGSKIMLREFKTGQHNIEDFVDSSYEIFKSEQGNIKNEVLVYEA